MMFLLAFPIGSLMFAICYYIHSKLGKFYTHPFSLASFLTQLPDESRKILNFGKDGIYYSDASEVSFQPFQEIQDLQKQIENILEDIVDATETCEELEEQLNVKRGEGDELIKELRKVELEIEKESHFIINMKSRIKVLHEEHQKKVEAEELQLAREQVRKTEELTKIVANNALKTASILEWMQQNRAQSKSLTEKLLQFLDDNRALKRFQQFIEHKKSEETKELGKKSSSHRLMRYFQPTKSSNKCSISDSDANTLLRTPEPNLELQTN